MAHVLTRSVTSPASPGTHLGPLRHLPLGPAGWVLADLALVRPGDVRGLAEIAVDGAVESRRDHLPAADDAELVALPAGAGTLAPAARLPPAETRETVVIGTAGPELEHPPGKPCLLPAGGTRLQQERAVVRLPACRRFSHGMGCINRQWFHPVDLSSCLQQRMLKPVC